jgi:EF hand
MSLHHLFFLSVVMSLGIATPVFAQSKPTPFENADQNGDGKVSLEEYRNRAVVLFFDYDHNGDNILTSDELPEYRNADGKVVPPDSLTLQDYTVAISHSFVMGDTDKDGYLSVSEWGIAPSLNK